MKNEFKMIIVYKLIYFSVFSKPPTKTHIFNGLSVIGKGKLHLCYVCVGNTESESYNYS